MPSTFLARHLLAVVTSTVMIVWGATGRGESRDPVSQPRLEITVVDEHGDRIDARIRVDAVGPLARLRGAGSNVHRRVLGIHGHAELGLVPGRYRLVASHGPEFSIAQRVVTIDTSDRKSVVLQIARSVDPGPYGAADFHVHTDASEDGRVPLGTRLASARAEGLAIVALTDHNRVTRSPDPANDGLFVLPSVEVTTWNPEVGHFNVFPAETPIGHLRRTPDSIFEEAHRERRLVQVNHPRLDEHIAYFELAGLRGAATERAGFGLGFDMLELWNGYDLGRPSVLWANFHEWLGLLEAGHRPTATGNSDSHRLDHTWVGYPRTYVELGGAEPTTDNVMRALGAGRAFVTTGPLLDVRVEGKRPGGTVRTGPKTTLRVAVRVMAAPYVDVDWIDVWLDSRWIRSIRVPASTNSLRFDRTVSVEASDAQNLVIAVRGGTPMDLLLPERGVLPMAFTNPIHLVHATRGPELSHVAHP